MKVTKLNIVLMLIFFIASSSCLIAQKKISPFSNEAKFLKGEKTNKSAHSYILNAKKYHPFLFADQLDVVKDEEIAVAEKTSLVYQTIKNHIERHGVKEADQLDVQKLILYLYGDYRTINDRLTAIDNEKHQFFLNTLIDYKAIEFKYMARIVTHINSEENYIVDQANVYLDKYT